MQRIINRLIPALAVAAVVALVVAIGWWTWRSWDECLEQHSWWFCARVLR